MTQLPVEPVLAGVRNFRDLGGLPTADGRRVVEGRLFRSGHLAHATTDDAGYLTGLGLHTVFDFRNAADRKLDGLDIPLPGVRSENIPLNDPAEGAEFWRMVRRGSVSQLREALSDGQAEQRMVTSYQTLVWQRTEEFGQVLHSLADDSLPALLHCAAGKDRAGLMIAVILLALGVEREAIEADYLESNAIHRRYQLRRDSALAPESSAEVPALLAPLFEARAGYLAAGFEAMAQRWGGVDGYLTEGLGLRSATRERLRQRLLEAV